MSTEFNYVVNVDTTRVMGAMADIRSQVGMAFGSPTGFASPATALPGGGMGASMGAGMAGLQQMSDVTGGISAGFNQMFSGMGRAPGGFGGTFTNQAIAHSPHYGAIQAETNIDEEWKINRFGLGAAQQYAPPGVNPAGYAMAVNANYVARQAESKQAAWSEASGAFMSAAGGMAAGGLAAGGIGLVTRGAEKMGLSKGWAGGARLIGGFGAYMAADYIVGGALREQHESARQAAGVAKELGVIVGAGRNLSNVEMHDVGWGAMKGARDSGMDAQVMGDVMAMARGTGLLPETTDPQKLRDEAGNLGRSVQEAAQVLHTSISSAIQVIKNAAEQGKSAREGIIAAAGMGGADEYNKYVAFGKMGSQVARANELSGAQGFGLFTGALGQMAGAGLSGEEMKIMGGKYSAAQFAATTTMGLAKSPLGDMQLMAGLTGDPLGDIYSLPGQAMAGLSQGGDIIGGAIAFATHSDQLRRGVGARGMQTMARNQIDMVANTIMERSPNTTQEDARILATMNTTGYSAMRSRAYAGSLFGGGGRGGGEGRGAAYARELGAYAELVAMPPGTKVDSPDFFDVAKERAKDTVGSFWGHVGTGAVAGANFGPWGLATGVLGGAAVWAGRQLWGTGTDIAEYGVGSYLWDKATDPEAVEEFEARKIAAVKDRAAQKSRQDLGLLKYDPEFGAGIPTADYSGVAMDIDALGGQVSADRFANMMVAMGVPTVAPGIGATKAGGKYFSSAVVQKIALGPKKQTAREKAAQRRNVRQAASNIASHEDTKAVVEDFIAAYEGIGKEPGAAEGAYKKAQELLDRAGGKENPAAIALREDFNDQVAGGLVSDSFLDLVSKLPGGKTLRRLEAGKNAGLGLAAGAKSAWEAEQSSVDLLAAQAMFGDFGHRDLQMAAIRQARSSKLWKKDPRAAVQDVIQSSRKFDDIAKAELEGDSYEDATVRAWGIDKKTVSKIFSDVDADLSDKVLAAGAAFFEGKDYSLKETETAAKDRVGGLKGKGGKGGGKGKGAEPQFQRALGFGEGESAMSTINRALKRTAKSIDTLHKAITSDEIKLNVTIFGGKK